MLTRHCAVLVTAAGLTLSAPHSAEAAGLFDFLFGGFGQPAPRYDVAPRPYGGALGVRVNPRKKQQQKAYSHVSPERKGKRQVAIDPVKNPNWFLDDPTLRRGDIVVLKSGVLVYEGGREPRSTEDFTPLQKSGLVSKGERETLQKMARPAGDLALAEPVDLPAKKVDGKEAALR